MNPANILERIRQLLGGHNAQKRRASEELSTHPDSIRKRFREASTFTLPRTELPNVRNEQLKRERRYTDFAGPQPSSMKNSYRQSLQPNNHSLNREPTPAHSPVESWQNHHIQSSLNNGGSYFIEDVMEPDHIYQTHRPQLPPLQPIQTAYTPNHVPQRQVPGLMKANPPNSQRKMNGPMPFNRQKLNNVPELYPLHQSVSTYNGDHYFQHTSATQRPRPSLSAAVNNCPLNHVSNRAQPTQNNFSGNRNYCGGNSLSLKQNVDHHLKENGLFGKKQTTTVPDKDSYSEWLKLIPFYNRTAKSKEIISRDTMPEPQDIIDLVNGTDDCIESIASNTTTVEPVNTLRTRLETRPVYDDNWVAKLNEQYSNINQSRSERVRIEKEKSSAAERATRKMEESFTERMQSLVIDNIYVQSEGEEEECNDFPPLSDEQLQKVSHWMYDRNTGAILISKFNLSISRHDIQTLSWDPLAWLNDEVINFYMELLGERSRLNESLPPVHGMNTFFLKRLLEAGYAGVRRWTRKVDIFAQEIIPVPVHKGIHWCMAIIHMKNKTIKYYDSMGAPNNVVLNALADYLQAESLDKKKQPLDMSGWTKENVPNIPQQENGSDCGVFSCMYAEFIARNRPITFTQQHMQYFRKRMIYEICTGKMIV